jgi:DNA-binding NarL/FixJ family response regulator
MKRIKLLIIEDNRLLRDGIVSMIGEQIDMKAVAGLGDGDKAPLKIRELKPDIVLLDLGLRSQNSLHLVQSLKRTFPETKIIVMDLVPIQSDVVNFVQAGVSGFILKDATIDDFLRTIRSVAKGMKVLPPLLTGSLFSQIVEQAVSRSAPSKLIESIRMTKRERQVIQLISDGLTNKEIAQKLYLSTYTVKSHVHNILEKLTLHTRLQIANYAHTSEDFSTTANIISLIKE